MNINKIIIEEFNKFLTEEYYHDKEYFTFTQRLNNSYFSNFDSFSTDFDTDITGSDIIITWKVIFDLMNNDAGIGRILVEVENIQGVFYYSLMDKRTDEVAPENENIQKDINEIKWNFNYNNVILSNENALSIKELEFDIKNKICIVVF